MTSIPAYDVPTTDLGSNAAPEVRKFDQHGDHAQKNPIVAQEEGLILDEKDHQNKQKGELEKCELVYSIPMITQRIQII